LFGERAQVARAGGKVDRGHQVLQGRENYRFRVKMQNDGACAVIPGASKTRIRNLEIPGSMRSLSSGRASRGPVGIAPE
jgi:hypothetical protein